MTDCELGHRLYGVLGRNKEHASLNPSLKYIPCKINVCGGFCWVLEVGAAAVAQAHFGGRTPRYKSEV
jgi:hypothetical protein